MDETYSLYTLGAGCRRSDEALNLMRAWMSNLPYTYFSVGITRESLLSENESLDVRLGIGALKRYREKLSLSLSSDIECFPAGKSVVMTAAVPDLFAITKKDISPLYEHVKEKGYRILSASDGRALASETVDGRTTHFISVRVLVE
ncbi:MAG: hypothetical protein WCT14_08675 [Treponemataceae bacterium]